MNRQTYIARKESVDRAWHEIDGTDQVLGRLAARIAVLLQGKHKPVYTPHVDTGDFVIVTNVERIRMTGSKPDQKLYKRFSGYPSGQKTQTYRWMLENQPEVLLESAVRRMLPKNKLAQQMLKKLKLYRGSEHPHQAQQPAPLEV